MRPSPVWLLLVLSASPAGAQTSSAPPGQVNPTQEVAAETPAGPAIVAGATEIRIGGYLGLNGIYRSTASGGGAGTSYATIPYDGSVTGNVSEARMSAQASRLSIRVNAAPTDQSAQVPVEAPPFINDNPASGSGAGSGSGAP